MADFAVGDDVLDGSGHLGTVRFVGVIPKSRAPEDVWVGVEWADPTRGKYDGSIYGVRSGCRQLGASQAGKRGFSHGAFLYSYSVKHQRT